MNAARLLPPGHLPLIAGFQSERINALVSATVREPMVAYRVLAAREYVGARTLSLARDAAVLHAYRQLHARRCMSACGDFR